MSNTDNNLEKQLKEIRKEDIIWFIFIILFLLKMYSNEVERDYRINNKESSRKKYHYINEFTYIVAIAIAIYYICTNWKSESKHISLITNGLSIIGLLIFVWLEIKSED